MQASLQMRLERTSILEAPAARVAELMADPKTMDFVLGPVVMVDPLEPSALPARWVPGRYRVRMWLFGLVPIGWQDIVIAEAPMDPARWCLHDAGRGQLARRWDHHLIVEALDARRARYTDRLEVDAGIATFLMWLFAHAVFAWRHHRWRRLVARLAEVTPEAAP
jgi:hypothetical protein